MPGALKHRVVGFTVYVMGKGMRQCDNRWIYQYTVCVRLKVHQRVLEACEEKHQDLSQIKAAFSF
jgi:hypothetical protein